MEKSVATFGRHALPVLWDWGEVVPTSDATGSFSVAVDWIANAVERTAKGVALPPDTQTSAMQSSATQHPLADDSRAAAPQREPPNPAEDEQ